MTADLLREVGTAFRWINLYRDTDPVAGPVTSWDHTHDGGPLTSRRLDDPAVARPDHLDPVPADPALQTPDARPVGDRPGARVGHQDRR